MPADACGEMRKAGIAAAATVLVVAGAFVWARVSLSGAALRADVALQLSEALGQPVSIGSIAPSLWPRSSVTFADVQIGDPVRASGARIVLPLPPFTLRSAPSGSRGSISCRYRRSA